jgi:hypothetical protein
MKKTTERTLVFLLWIVLICLAAALEAWTIYTIVQTGKISQLNGALGAISGGALAALMWKFVKLVNKMFIEKDLVSEEDLKRYFRRRLDRIDFPGRLDPEDKDTFFRGLLGDVLRMTEEILHNWVGPHRYELSVFSDPNHPEIIAYYDSGGHATPRSKANREHDPDYYKKSGYKVVELLAAPSDEVIVIPKTTDPSVKYKFLNDKQREKIKSTLLYCFCTQTPLALVVVCDSPGAIQGKDSRLKNLINAVGMAMNCDYSLGTKLH